MVIFALTKKYGHMLEFTNNERGKIVSFNNYYRFDGVGRKVTSPIVKTSGKIIDYSEEITENGSMCGFIVEDTKGKLYFVLEADCTLAE